MLTRQIIFCIVMLLCFCTVAAQNVDSTLESLQQIPVSYINAIDSKIDKYSNRVIDKTEKTLIKLSRWENKIHQLLQEVNPEAAEKLFSNNQLTFGVLLQKFQEGKELGLQYRNQHDEYRDKLTTGIKYLETQKQYINQKLVEPLQEARKKMAALNEEEDKSEAIQQFIKERKKQLIDGALQYIGKSKYLSKINKEAWYYAETLKNYKQIFNDPEKAEEVIKVILNKIPGFQQFVQKNSMLAGLFDISSATAQLIPGMQTRAGVQQLMRSNMAGRGGNAQQTMSQNLQAAQSQLSSLRTRIGNGYGSGGGMPDFKPNTQKTKTFGERIEYGTNFQFTKSDGFMPSTTAIGFSIGFKMNDKLIAGLGLSYKLGMGSISNIHFTNEGIGLRSFIDWKLKKQFFISGGFEMNYNNNFDRIATLKKIDVWQRSALLGLTKKFNVKTKLFKGTNVQILYDFLSQQHIPTSQPFLFRIGYSIN